MEETATKPVTPFQRLGGAETFHAIADRFYALMDADPAYADLRAMHGADLAPMKASLAGFLIGWSGGPRDWFAQGKCMMSLHRPLPISDATAKQWADAMRRPMPPPVCPAPPRPQSPESTPQAPAPNSKFQPDRPPVAWNCPT
jgi:hemoglobin